MFGSVILVVSGLLQQGHIDIAPVDFSITFNRSQAIDFLPSLSESYLQLFLKNPLDTLNWQAYVDPFTKKSWFAIIGFFFIAPIIITLIMTYGKSLFYLSK